jgi:hypothetical protein
LYRVYYNDGGTPTMVPDANLPGNSAGFSVSPINLSGLNNNSFDPGEVNPVFSQLAIAVEASTTNTSLTPSVEDWTFAYDTHVPRTNFSFNMRGAKLIGTDASFAPVYKYNLNPQTNSSGIMATTSLEWDTYTISKSGYQIAESCPAQPQYMAPDIDSNTYIDMAPSTSNAILVQVKTVAGAEIPGALVRLYRATAPAFDQTKKTGMRCGQAFWGSLDEGTSANGKPYAIDVSAPPYTGTTTIANVDVSGYSTITAIAN